MRRRKVSPALGREERVAHALWEPGEHEYLFATPGGIRRTAPSIKPVRYWFAAARIAAPRSPLPETVMVR